MLKVVRESGGWGETRTDREIVDAIKLLAQTEGIWTEPAGGTTLAVTMKLIEQGRIPRDESIVVSITGNGYKTLEAVQGTVEQPFAIPARLADFDELYARLARRHATQPAARARNDGDWQPEGGVDIMVQVRIPTPLRKYTGGAEAVQAEGATRRRARRRPRQAAIPGIKERICDESGRRCGGSSTSSSTARTSASCSNLDTPVKDGDEMSDRAGHRRRALSAARMTTRRCRRRRDPAGPGRARSWPVGPRPDRQHAAGRDPRASATASAPGVRLFAKLEGFNPGRLGEGPPGAAR